MIEPGLADQISGRAAELRLLGDALCLDFVNTVDPRRGPRPVDVLRGYDDLVAWAAHAAAVTDEDAGRLAAIAVRQPEEAARVLFVAKALREAIYRVFVAVARGGRPDAADLGAVAAARAAATARERIAPNDAGGFAWVWDADPPSLDRPLWPVARSAADLLTTGRLDRIHECPGVDDCGWLFLDTSKNGSRRWCSMEGCGNRAKSRRFLARHAAGRRHN